MEDLKNVVAKNIISLRQERGMTQLDLATKLNYSDKAVSKWERGESVPNINVLKEIADLFGVSIDYLVSAVHPKEEIKKTTRRFNHKFIIALSILLVWLLSTLAFVVLTISLKDDRYNWLSFIYAIPVSFIVWIVFNSIWYNRRFNYILISLLMWTVLLVVHLTGLAFNHNLWLLYITGIPGQIIIILWSRVRMKNKGL